jgi:cytochrome b6-f complex iron-sulfur subunit
VPRFHLAHVFDGTAEAHEQPCAVLRRTMLKSLGALAASALPVIGAGCSPAGGQLDNASGQTCGGNVCVDLASPDNEVLTQVNGAALLEAPNGDTLVVIRTDATSAVALSAVCTHQGCVVDFDAARRILSCPCHGSQFSEDGSVLRGPARRALSVYEATVAEDEMTMTISL